MKETKEKAHEGNAGKAEERRDANEAAATARKANAEAEAKVRLDAAKERKERKELSKYLVLIAEE